MTTIQDQRDEGVEGAEELMTYALERELTLPVSVDDIFVADESPSGEIEINEVASVRSLASQAKPDAVEQWRAEVAANLVVLDVAQQALAEQIKVAVWPEFGDVIENILAVSGAGTPQQKLLLLIGSIRHTEIGYCPDELLTGDCTAAMASAPAVATATRKQTGPLPMEKTPDIGTFPHVKYDKEMNPVALKATLENTEKLLNVYGITSRYNEMTRRLELNIPGMKFTDDNKANVSLSHIKSLARRVNLPVSELQEYVVAIGEKHNYHPVRNWIASKPWDGKSRLQDLFDTLVVDYEYLEHRDALVRRWLISAVAAAFCDTPEKFEGVLTLQGEQGIGKTSWLLALSPIAGGILDGFTLDPDNKDSVAQFNSNWIVELGELDGVFRKADVAKLKAFISKKDDALRRAYAAMESFFKRRTVSAATVNGDAFLVDATGNRRWWTIPVQSIVFNHGIDMQQLWAEVLTLFRANEQWWLTDAEDRELRRVNGQHEQSNPIDELVRELFVFGQSELAMDGLADGTKTLRMTASGVAKALGLAYDKKSVINEIGMVLRKLTGEKSKPHGKGRFWELQPAKGKATSIQTFAF